MAAAAAAAQMLVAIQCMLELTSATPGTLSIPYKLDEDNEAGRTECYPGETDLKQSTVMKHLEPKDGEQRGLCMG